MPGLIWPAALECRVPSLPRPRKQASENGKGRRADESARAVTGAGQNPRNSDRKVANSPTPARMHSSSSHAARTANEAAECIPKARPHRTSPCCLRCALPSCSPGEYLLTWLGLIGVAVKAGGDMGRLIFTPGTGFSTFLIDLLTWPLRKNTEV